MKTNNKSAILAIVALSMALLSNCGSDKKDKETKTPAATNQSDLNATSPNDNALDTLLASKEKLSDTEFRITYYSNVAASTFECKSEKVSQRTLPWGQCPINENSIIVKLFDDEDTVVSIRAVANGEVDLTPLEIVLEKMTDDTDNTDDVNDDYQDIDDDLIVTVCPQPGQYEPNKNGQYGNGQYGKDGKGNGQYGNGQYYMERVKKNTKYAGKGPGYCSEPPTKGECKKTSAQYGNDYCGDSNGQYGNGQYGNGGNGQYGNGQYGNGGNGQYGNGQYGKYKGTEYNPDGNGQYYRSQNGQYKGKKPGKKDCGVNTGYESDDDNVCYQ